MRLKILKFEHTPAQGRAEGQTDVNLEMVIYMFSPWPLLRYEAFQIDPKESFEVDQDDLIEIFLTPLPFSLDDPTLKVHAVGNIFEHSIVQDTIRLHPNIQDPEI